MAALDPAVEELSSDAGRREERRIAVIVNTGSRTGNSDIDEAVRRIGTGGKVVSVDSADDLETFLKLTEKAAGIADIVVVGGGDGTLSATFPIFLRSGRTMGILPLGTANDLARTLGIPFDPVAAAEVIATGEVRSIDLGEINGQPFCNAISIGFAADLALHQYGRLKKLLGVLHYPVRWLAVYRRFRPFAATLRYYGGECRFASAFMLTVANGRHHGGGITVDEMARIDDGALDIYCLGSVGVWRLMHAFFHLRRGKLRQASRTTLLNAREVQISTSVPLPINVDGDVRTETPATLRVLPRAVSVLTPRSSIDGLERKAAP